MKRRLSVGVASIGSPSIIFLDEPTTGMDPVNRRSVWHLIQEMKQDKVIILTTHAMEEAEVTNFLHLSDSLTFILTFLGFLSCRSLEIELL
jgi:ABC-type multidrug transport system ATPase subunit